jgi:hypothetical protein
MIFCDNPIVEKWVAPPQEDLPRPTWTRLRAGGLELSNSIEYANWGADPVEPIVCESCWDATCSRAGLARIVLLAGQVLWLKPSLQDIDEFWRGTLNEGNFIQEAVVFSLATWESLRQQFARLPTPQSMPRPTRNDIAGLWLNEMPRAIRVRALDQLDSLLRSALASGPMDLDPARETVRSICRWINSAPSEHVVGRVVRTDAVHGQLNTFYFDIPPAEDWSAFAVGRDRCLGLSEGWIFETLD